PFGRYLFRYRAREVRSGFLVQDIRDVQIPIFPYVRDYWFGSCIGNRIRTGFQKNKAQKYRGKGNRFFTEGKTLYRQYFGRYHLWPGMGFGRSLSGTYVYLGRNGGLYHAYCHCRSTFGSVSPWNARKEVAPLRA